MELDTQAALTALESWRAGLPNLPPDAEFGPPEWINCPARPTLADTMRGCLCYVFTFEQPFNSSPGFVLNADRLAVQLIHGGSDESLAAALSIVTMRPAPTRRNGRREV